MARTYTEEETSAWRDEHYSQYFEESRDLENLHQEWWGELDPDLQALAVAYLRLHLPDFLKKEVRRKFARYDSEWMDHMFEEKLEEEQKEFEASEDYRDDFPPLAAFYSFHMAEGMGVRNLLRQIITDDELPSGNWDDYYCAALLRAR